MKNNANAAHSPKEGVLKRFLILIPLTVVLAIGSFLYIQSKKGTYVAEGYTAYSDEEFQARSVTFSNPGVLEVVSVGWGSRNNVRLEFRALADGETNAVFGTENQDDEQWRETWVFVVRDGFIVEGGINFAGWEVLNVCLLVLLLALTVLFASVFVRLWRASWYGYTMIASVSGLLFSLYQLGIFTLLLGRHGVIDFRIFLLNLAEVVDWFAAISLYPMLPMAFLVSISNILLIRHEGRRPVNLLGIAASVLWAAAYLWLVTASFNNSPALHVVYQLIVVTMTVGECLLFSTILCAWLASRHVPKRRLDYLVVLGCGIRADGTPCPLLAGRVDRAVAFDRAMQDAGNAPAIFVPSGGQGPDEPMSEAQSMGDYLEEHWDVTRDRIVLEGRSTTTHENMAFSREVIEKHAGCDVANLRVGFSTTNYHVFRGYVCAHQAGMSVEGMGSKTKYYFWPNAFLREFVGLLANRWKGILLLYAAVVAIYLLVSYAADMVPRPYM